MFWRRWFSIWQVVLQVNRSTHWDGNYHKYNGWSLKTQVLVWRETRKEEEQRQHRSMNISARIADKLPLLTPRHLLGGSLSSQSSVPSFSLNFSFIYQNVMGKFLAFFCLFFIFSFLCFLYHLEILFFFSLLIILVVPKIGFVLFLTQKRRLGVGRPKNNGLEFGCWKQVRGGSACRKSLHWRSNWSSQSKESHCIAHRYTLKDLLMMLGISFQWNGFIYFFFLKKNYLYDWRMTMNRFLGSWLIYC